jgi:hypothetical protein
MISFVKDRKPGMNGDLVLTEDAVLERSTPNARRVVAPELPRDASCPGA